MYHKPQLSSRLNQKQRNSLDHFETPQRIQSKALYTSKSPTINRDHFNQTIEKTVKKIKQKKAKKE